MQLEPGHPRPPLVIFTGSICLTINLKAIWAVVWRSVLRVMGLYSRIHVFMHLKIRIESLIKFVFYQ